MKGKLINDVYVSPRLSAETDLRYALCKTARAIIEWKGQCLFLSTGTS